MSSVGDDSAKPRAIQKRAESQQMEAADQFEKKPERPVQSPASSRLSPSSRVVVSAEQHIGPLPTPDDFLRYNEALPGAADRILKMAERDQEMQQDGAEKNYKLQLREAGHAGKSLEYQFALGKRGQVFAFILAVGTMGGAVFLMAIGKWLSAMAPLLISLALIVPAFILTRKKADDGDEAPPSQKDNGAPPTN